MQWACYLKVVAYIVKNAWPLNLLIWETNAYSGSIRWLYTDVFCKKIDQEFYIKMKRGGSNCASGEHLRRASRLCTN